MSKAIAPLQNRKKKANGKAVVAPAAKAKAETAPKEEAAVETAPKAVVPTKAKLAVETAPEAEQASTVQPAVQRPSTVDATEREGPGKKPVAKNSKQTVSRPDPVKTDPGCPASKKEEDLERELQELTRRAKPASNKTDQIRKKPPSSSAKTPATTPAFIPAFDDTARFIKKEMFVSFYREQYERLQMTTVDTSHYQQNALPTGLSIKSGHQHMPKPLNVALPSNFREPVGTLTPEQLKLHDCYHERMMISIHGDIFDVSDRPDKYGEDGPYWEMSGRDITWGLVCGNDVPELYDEYYDLFKFPPEVLDRKLQGLCSWVAFFTTQYGEPVGRLSVYESEWRLPAPPHDATEECSIM